MQNVLHRVPYPRGRRGTFPSRACCWTRGICTVIMYLLLMVFCGYMRDTRSDAVPRERSTGHLLGDSRHSRGECHYRSSSMSSYSLGFASSPVFSRLSDLFPSSFGFARWAGKPSRVPQSRTRACLAFQAQPVVVARSRTGWQGGHVLAQGTLTRSRLQPGGGQGGREEFGRLGAPEPRAGGERLPFAGAWMLGWMLACWGWRTEAQFAFSSGRLTVVVVVVMCIVYGEGRCCAVLC